MLDLCEVFAKHDHEYGKFERIEQQLSGRPDLHAFLLLDSIVAGDRDVVSWAGHDEIYLDVSPEELAEAATEEQVTDLIRCGVRYEAASGALCMFV